MTTHNCKQIENLANIKTEIALLKQSYIMIDRIQQEEKNTKNTNRTLLITSLTGTIFCLIGLIAILLEN